MPEKGTWYGVYGMSDPDYNNNIRTDMVFDIGSNTKTFVAALTLLLEEEGLLTLDDQLHQWLPTFPNIDSTITIRQILSHTSGVKDFANENPEWSVEAFGAPDTYWTPEKSLSYVLKPNFAPGKSWSYSNTGYVLAGMIIKEATNSENFAPILRQKILDPLNLNNTYLDPEEIYLDELAHGWFHTTQTDDWVDMNQISRIATHSSLWTAGAMVSNTENMINWVRALYTGAIINESSLEKMLTFVDLNAQELEGYGLGVMKYKWFNELIWAHGGDTFGYGSQAAYYPKQDVCIVVLVNQRNNPYVDLYNMISKQFLKEIMKYYKKPYDKVYPYDTEIASSYIRPNLDSLKIITKINNPKEHNVQVVAKVVSFDSTYIDSTILYDDGIHNDNQAGDNIYGGYISISVEKEFQLDITSKDLETDYSYTINDVDHFTTIGPIVFEDYKFILSDTIPNPGDNLAFLLTLKNSGSTTIASNIKASLTNLDTLGVVPTFYRSYGDIGVGETAVCNSRYLMKISESCPDSCRIPIKIDIYSNIHKFWCDTFYVNVYSNQSVIKANDENILPKEFTLFQNYPNPFNATTIISYQIPNSSNVELDVYSITGQHIATLISQHQTAGNYKYEWDANNFASGVYFYKITAGDFVQMKKLILLK